MEVEHSWTKKHLPPENTHDEPQRHGGNFLGKPQALREGFQGFNVDIRLDLEALRSPTSGHHVANKPLIGLAKTEDLFPMTTTTYKKGPKHLFNEYLFKPRKK